MNHEGPSASKVFSSRGFSSRAQCLSHRHGHRQPRESNPCDSRSVRGAVVSVVSSVLSQAPNRFSSCDKCLREVVRCCGMWWKHKLDRSWIVVRCLSAASHHGLLLPFHLLNISLASVRPVLILQSATFEPPTAATTPLPLILGQCSLTYVLRLMGQCFWTRSLRRSMFGTRKTPMSV